MIFYVEVGVALTRPLPDAPHQWRRYAIEAGSEQEAALVAAQMASCTSVMPMAVDVVGDEAWLTPRQEWRLKQYGAYVDTKQYRTGPYSPPGVATCDCGHRGAGLAWHDASCPAYRYLWKVLYT